MIKCSADAALAEKITRARELLAHKFPRGELEHILNAALEALLDDMAPERKAMRQEKRRQAKAVATGAAINKKTSVRSAKESSASTTAQKVSTTVAVEPSSPTTSPGPNESLRKTPSRYIPAGTKLAVWQECEGQCAYVSPDGQRCTERRALEYDHVMPFALGGDSNAENLRCYCRSHNKFAAFKTYGPHQPWRHSQTHSASR